MVVPLMIRVPSVDAATGLTFHGPNHKGHAMALHDENEPRPRADQISIGQDLSLWSVAELEERIRVLEGEIARTRQDIDRKSGHRSQANALFNLK
jgi:uncharacterized small protein (DUF1192 family)